MEDQKIALLQEQTVFVPELLLFRLLDEKGIKNSHVPNAASLEHQLSLPPVEQCHDNFILKGEGLTLLSLLFLDNSLS